MVQFNVLQKFQALYQNCRILNHIKKQPKQELNLQISHDSSFSFLLFAFRSSVPDALRSPSRFLGLYFVTKVGSSSRQR
jgi:hypothetical protein